MTDEWLHQLAETLFDNWKRWCNCSTSVQSVARLIAQFYACVEVYIYQARCHHLPSYLPIHQIQVPSAVQLENWTNLNQLYIITV